MPSRLNLLLQTCWFLIARYKISTLRTTHGFFKAFCSVLKPETNDALHEKRSPRGKVNFLDWLRFVLQS